MTQVNLINCSRSHTYKKSNQSNYVWNANCRLYIREFLFLFLFYLTRFFILFIWVCWLLSTHNGVVTTRNLATWMEKWNWVNFTRRQHENVKRRRLGVDKKFSHLYSVCDSRMVERLLTTSELSAALTHIRTQNMLTLIITYHRESFEINHAKNIRINSLSHNHSFIAQDFHET